MSTDNVMVYDRLMDQLAREVAPQTRIEWLWLKDYFDGTWEILRIRRAKTLIIENATGRALQSMLAPVLRNQPGHLLGILVTPLGDEIATTWYRGPEGKAKIADLLKQHGLSMDNVLEKIICIVRLYLYFTTLSCRKKKKSV